MNAVHLGFFNTATSRTRVRFTFSTHDPDTGANIAPSSAFEAADLRIYRANDGAAFSATERASAAGITMTSPFDTLTGFHAVDIDLTDNTDAGFYAAGYLYAVVLAPDETIDTQVITGVVLAYFEIGVAKADVTHVAATAQTAGDIIARLGTPAGASISADLAAIEAQTDDIGAAGAGLTAITGKTDNLPTDPADQSLIIAATDAIMSRLGVPAGASVSADIAAIESQTDDIGVAGAGLSAIPGLSNLDAAVSSRAAPGDAMALTAAERNATADALLARSSNGLTVAQLLAGGAFNISIVAGVLTVKYGDGSTAFTRTVTREDLNAISALVP